MRKEKKDLISVIVPCYNEEEVVSKYYEEMKKQIDNINEI